MKAYYFPKVTSATLACLTAMLLLGSMTSNAQQFFSYTQYMNNLTPLNHTYSVVDGNSSVSGLYRKQWTGIDGAPSSFVFSSALQLPAIGSATGITAMDDKFGIEHQTEVNAYFAKSVQLATNNYLALSLNAGFRNYRADYSSLDPADPMFFSADIRRTDPNIGFGLMYYSNRYYIGLSVPEINLRSVVNDAGKNNTRFRSQYYFSGAYLTGKEEDEIRVKPAILV
ncbi:MAG: PorP/SprF family type IX secretion system membrane protein, partial [Chitinophagaceae bacterium]